jgi:putative FmdB family regulatory protein
MPKYQYACMDCDLDYEKERAITDAEPIYHCDKCGYALVRVYSPVGVTFKGGGFYTTDNR